MQVQPVPRQSTAVGELEPAVVTCTFSEVVDVLFHVSFAVPFAPPNLSRAFDALKEMRDLRLLGTAEDWEEARRYATALVFGERILRAWRSWRLRKRLGLSL